MTFLGALFWCPFLSAFLVPDTTRGHLYACGGQLSEKVHCKTFCS